MSRDLIREDIQKFTGFVKSISGKQRALIYTSWWRAAIFLFLFTSANLYLSFAGYFGFWLSFVFEVLVLVFSFGYVYKTLRRVGFLGLVKRSNIAAWNIAQEKKRLEKTLARKQRKGRG